MFKFMNNPYLHSTFYAPDDTGSGAGSGADDTGDGGEEDDQDDHDDTDADDGQDEKKFTQKDIDDAVKKRLERAKKKWQRDSQKNHTDKGDDDHGAGDGADKGDKEDKELQKERQKAERLEMKLACFEAGVSKEAVDDVSALARAYMTDDDDLDFEDAIEKVVKKYPQFKKAVVTADDDEDDNTKGKSWGMRQSGKGAKKLDGVEAAFLKRNPGLKID